MAGIPDSVGQLLDAADERNGFPKGTMASVMQQEAGGNLEKFLGDPAAYHYDAGPDGRRVAPHTGQVSTAFGPFGILESTGAQPGYGVAPLKDKSLPEQVRFASDYLAARSKASGGLQSGLAGYGEGTKYAQQVVGRVGGQGAAPPVVVASAAAPGAPPNSATSAPPVDSGAVALPPELLSALESHAPAAGGSSEADAWGSFLKAMPATGRPMQVADLNFGAGQVQPMSIRPPTMGRPAPGAYPNFAAFSAWKRGRQA